MATESSVLVNLKDLFELEAERLADEAVRAERAKAAEAARIEAERRATEERVEAARAEERRRAEEERARRDAAVEDRLQALKGELAEVRAQREEMRLKVTDLSSRASAPKSSRGSWIAGAMAAASLALAVTATAVAWPEAPAPALASVEPAPAVVHEATPAAEPAPRVEAPVVEEPETVVATATPEPVRPRRPRVPRTPREQEHTLTRQLDLGEGNEVLSEEFLNGAGN